MSDSLRDQLLGLGFKPPPKPERKPEGKRDPRHDSRHDHKRERGKPPAHDARKPHTRGPRQGAAAGAGAKPGPGRDHARGKPRGNQADIDLAKAYAIRAQREKDERIEAERLKQEAARERREARARLAQLVQGKALNDPAAEIARHFEYGGKIKRIHVTEAQLRALNAGELGVIQIDGRYLLVDAATLALAAETFPPSVALRVDPDAPTGDDPYADPQYQVPDDLVW
jgi:uncharacterized protein YaiL (DUF2058 family)